MISAPAIGCVPIRFSSSVSAGGQSEHPSDVNSSTMTGVRPTPLRSCVPTHAASSATAANDPVRRRILRILAPQLNPTFRASRFPGFGYAAIVVDSLFSGIFANRIAATVNPTLVESRMVFDRGTVTAIGIAKESSAHETRCLTSRSAGFACAGLVRARTRHSDRHHHGNGAVGRRLIAARRYGHGFVPGAAGPALDDHGRQRRVPHPRP